MRFDVCVQLHPVVMPWSCRESAPTTPTERERISATQSGRGRESNKQSLIVVETEDLGLECNDSALSPQGGAVSHDQVVQLL